VIRLQDAPVHRVQRRPRVHPELLTEPAPHPVENRQHLSLPTAPGARSLAGGRVVHAAPIEPGLPDLGSVDLIDGNAEEVAIQDDEVR
jgi:hypothetical protein